MTYTGIQVIVNTKNIIECGKDIMPLSRFGKKPMHLFGVLGTLMFVLGFSIFAYVGGYKIYAMVNEIKAENIANMSSFYIALTSMIIGVQLFLAGFIGELISRNAQGRNNYQIEKEI